MIDEVLRIDLMRQAVAEAKLSEAEDSRLHPKVGAILTDMSGSVLCRAHRGEQGGGQHAEYILLQKVLQQGIDLKDKILFVTLEPCTRRGVGKTPCAVRVLRSGIKHVFIGTLDPDPRITGKGEIHLSYHINVERFPQAIQKELFLLNREFFSQHRHSHIPCVSAYAAPSGTTEHEAIKPGLSEQREGLLQQSADLISGTDGSVVLFSGPRISWLRELHLGLLQASFEGRMVRILSSPSETKGLDFEINKRAAIAAGVDVGIAPFPVQMRGVLVSPMSDRASMILVEKSPSLHGVLLQAPHEGGILLDLAKFFETAWERSQIEKGETPHIVSIDEEKLSRALLRGVPQYARANIRLSRVPTDNLVPLALRLERFKLFRLNQLAALQERHGVPVAALIDGSPWPITPPVVEILKDGRLVVIDGVHRAFSAVSRGQEQMDVILVMGISDDLPARPLNSWDDVEVVTEKLPREKRYLGFRPELFRPIRSAFSTLLTD